MQYNSDYRQNRLRHYHLMECFPQIYNNGIYDVTTHWDKIMDGTEQFLNEQTKSLYDETDWGGMAEFYMDRENYEKVYNKLRNSL